MIRTKVIEETLREGRLNAKTVDSLFGHRIEQGANCSPSSPRRSWTLSRRFLPSAPRTPITSSASGGSGSWSSRPVSRRQVARTMPEGQRRADPRCRPGGLPTPPGVWRRGPGRSRILRLTAEAREQGGLLSYEDLAFRLFNCGIRTIVRDVQALRRRQIEVPSRGQQRDIGPGQTHRVQAVRLYLQGLEAKKSLADCITLSAPLRTT